MKKTILIIAFLSIFSQAWSQMRVRWHNEQADTTLITKMLIDVEAMNLNSSEAVISALGQKLIGTPYKSGTLEGEPEMLTINTAEMDCTTYVETVMAMAMTLKANRSSWRDFVYYLTQLRYRNGVCNGYASRLHYISDWIVNNSHRGIIREMTDRVARADHAIKTLDFMSQNSEKYPALKNDSVNLAEIKNIEIGYRSHRFPYIKQANIKKATLKEGDVVMITTRIKGLDVSHMGIITFIDGTPHLLHASTKAKKVTVDPLPLHEYLRRNRQTTGIRVIRLTE